MILSRYLPHPDLDRVPQEIEQFGETDGRLTFVLNNLANLYRDQKKYAQAEPLYRRALAIREARLSPAHLLVGIHRHKIGKSPANVDSNAIAHEYGSNNS